MATPSITDDDVLLIVPVGARRTARILLPPETAVWLRDQLIIAIGKPEPEPGEEAAAARAAQGR